MKEIKTYAKLYIRFFYANAILDLKYKKK